MSTQTDYISREAAKKEISLNFGGVSHAMIANRIIDGIPAADVRPVVHAKWEEVEVMGAAELPPLLNVTSMYCPKCKKYHNEVYFYGNPTETANFCSFCGSVMDGGSKNAE